MPTCNIKDVESGGTPPPTSSNRPAGLYNHFHIEGWSLKRLVLNYFLRAFILKFLVLSGCFLKCHFVKYVCYIVNLKIKHSYVSLEHYTVLFFYNEKPFSQKTVGTS